MKGRLGVFRPISADGAPNGLVQALNVDSEHDGLGVYHTETKDLLDISTAYATGSCAETVKVCKCPTQVSI